jgi:hypothetical protein
LTRVAPAPGGSRRRVGERRSEETEQQIERDAERDRATDEDRATPVAPVGSPHHAGDPADDLEPDPGG